MNNKIIRMVIDISMTMLSIIMMGGTMLFPDDRVHQILGMVLLALWAVHITLNRRWYGSLFKGKYNPYRILQTIVNSSILICAVLLMVSGMMMAWFVPSEIIGGGLGFARTAHLVASHWYYVFMAFHIGLHLNVIFSRMRIKRAITVIILRVICALISIYGVYAFTVRGLWKYMFFQQQFFFLDLERGYLLFAVDYLSILVLFAAAVHYLGNVIIRRQK